MASQTRAALWIGRAGFLGLALVLMLLRLLPLDTLPPVWAGPDLLLAATLAWCIRRPALAPVWLVAGLQLLADMLLQRPPGLEAALVVLVTEALRRRHARLRSGGFLAEWLAAALATVAVLGGVAAVLWLTLLPPPPALLLASQAAATVLAYPLVVLAARWLFGLGFAGRPETRRIRA
ncbi:rod shape-determining protein MreD [Limimaricola pyoseonensis]|uniref:Rod shape-determining protein MreD n=1 Tax=Limimaricola pyoseonensis TaxID=521013 RepID=A0A1G7G3Q0_9RHOB|nr:rod shape-determining protein MreD [Limimaricola pyoseonensis]SDE82752.1 rod shape-determining protein MreD [Limimaricola pyoseonensis]